MNKAGFIIVLGLTFLCGIACMNKKELAIDHGKVVAVKDGDTIEILVEEQTVKIRFAHIDCPEKNQPFGKKAKQATSDLCFGQKVRVIHNNEYDRYKRLIAEIINERGECVNKELVKSGLAWHYIKYSSDTSYQQLEIRARTEKTGIWSEENPIAPWNWRKENKK